MQHQLSEVRRPFHRQIHSDCRVYQLLPFQGPSMVIDHHRPCPPLEQPSCASPQSFHLTSRAYIACSLQRLTWTVSWSSTLESLSPQGSNLLQCDDGICHIGHS